MPKRIEDVVRERGYYVTKPKGMSMFPMIRRSCTDICVVRAKLPLDLHDVPVYKRSDGTYVMHRVLAVRPDGYVCCGDNQWVLEEGVTDDMIVGVLSSWHSGGRAHSTTDKGYRRYVRFWCRSLGLRRFILFFCHKWWSLRGYGIALVNKFRRKR